MSMVTRVISSIRLVSLLVAMVSSFGLNGFVLAADTPEKTVIADFLMIDGDLYIVRGERGEIQIEVTPNTKISEKFTFGDRIKAVLLPNDVAKSITRAAPTDPIETITHKPSEPTPPSPVSTQAPTVTEKKAKTAPRPSDAPTHKISDVRVVVADLLMVDGSFYIVRTEYGEIQIEITSDTQLSEDFQFGDKIKARITPSDKALSVVRAGKNELAGIQDETASEVPPTPQSPVPPPPSAIPPSPVSSPPSSAPSEKDLPEQPTVKTPAMRTIVADVLMVDGDFIIVRGERGEIRIEVTPKTTVSEEFDYGDRIKAVVLPNDKALTVERASPNDPLGITP